MKMRPLTLFTHEHNRLVDIALQPGKKDGDLFLAKNMGFAEAIWNGTPSPVPADEMLITNVIIQGLIDSSKAGREVEVSVPEV
jgi:hypothetical protein